MGNIDAEALQTRFLAAIMGACFASLWGMLLGIGHIIRAIYFLPGDAMKECAQTAVIGAKTRIRHAIRDAAESNENQM